MAGAFAARGGHAILATRRLAAGRLALFSVASAILALAGPSTTADLEGMLAPPFEVTTPRVVGLVVVAVPHSRQLTTGSPLSRPG